MEAGLQRREREASGFASGGALARPKGMEGKHQKCCPLHLQTMAQFMSLLLSVYSGSENGRTAASLASDFPFGGVFFRSAELR